MLSPRGWWSFLLFAPLAHADAVPGIVFAPQQCSVFQWSNVPGVSERAAIVIPVTLESKTYYFQLDTGAYLTYLKGDVAQKNGWLNSSDHAVSLPAMSVAGATLAPSKAANLPSIKSRTGTLGLSSLMGRRLVIDYPSQRICLIDPEQWDTENDQYFEWMPASLVKGRLSVAMTIGDEAIPNVLVDSGSSMFSLLLKSDVWKKYTGITRDRLAPLKISSGAWGKQIEILGAPINVPISFGNATIKQANIYTVRPVAEEDRMFSSDSFQGILGNALLWERIVVMKLDGPELALGISKSSD